MSSEEKQSVHLEQMKESNLSEQQVEKKEKSHDEPTQDEKSANDISQNGSNASTEDILTKESKETDLATATQSVDSQIPEFGRSEISTGSITEVQ